MDNSKQKCSSVSNHRKNARAKSSRKVAASVPLRDETTGVWRFATQEEACGKGSTETGRGFFGELTESQWDALVEFRKATEIDISRAEWAVPFYHDVLRVRFLRARQFDVEKAAALFRADIAWRESFLGDFYYGRQRFLDIWTQTEIHRRITEYWPSGWHGFDMSQDEAFRMPVFWERISEVHAKSFCSLIETEDFLRWHAWIQESTEVDREERMVRLNRWLDREVQVHIVQDLRHLGMSQFHKPALDIVGGCGEMDDNHYPESLKAITILGVGRVFQIFWKVLKGFFDPVTRAKFDFIRSDEVGFPIVKALVGSTDDICDYLEGSTCGPHRHSGRPCLPAAGLFVLDIEAGDDSEEEGSNVDGETFTVAAGAKVERKVPVLHAGAKLVWDCSVAGHDVGLALFVENSSGKAKNAGNDDARFEIETFERVAQSANDPFVGEFETERAGTYIFVFDNTYSWTRAKDVTFTVAVAEPVLKKKHRQKKKGHRRK